MSATARRYAGRSKRRRKAGGGDNDSCAFGEQD